LINILDFIFGNSLNPFATTISLVLAALVAGICAFLLSPQRTYSELAERNVPRMVLSFELLVVVIFFLVPLHPYDHVALSFVAMALLAFPLSNRWPVLVGLLICIRPRNLLSLVRIENPGSVGFPESFLLSIALLVLLVGVLWSMYAETQSDSTSLSTQYSGKV
jgi:hypothetical protein